MIGFILLRALSRPPQLSVWECGSWGLLGCSLLVFSFGGRPFLRWLIALLKGAWAVTVFVMQTVSMYVAQKLRAKKQKTSHRESKGGREAHPCFPIENAEACELAPEESVPIIGQPVPPLGNFYKGMGLLKLLQSSFLCLEYQKSLKRLRGMPYP